MSKAFSVNSDATSTSSAHHEAAQGGGRRIVFLDMDGTLVESNDGIFASIQLTYEHFGKEMPTGNDLMSFIGPPLIDSFMGHGFPDAASAQEATDYFRISYTQPYFDDPKRPGHKIPGLFRSTLYDGIVDQLHVMKSHGYQLNIATCKPQEEAEKLCVHLGLTDLLDEIYGASGADDTSRIHKDQVIAWACEQISYNPRRGDRAVMVGDRWTDIDGAHDNSIPAVGVAWGFAQDGEFEKHNTDAVARSIDVCAQTVMQLCDTYEYV